MKTFGLLIFFMKSSLRSFFLAKMLHSFFSINFHSDYQQNNRSPKYSRCLQFSICVRTDIVEEL